MLLARECIMRMPCWFSMEECVCMLTENVRRFYQECGMMELVKMDASARLTCSIVLYSKRRHEVWMIGDCQFRYGGKHIRMKDRRCFAGWDSCGHPEIFDKKWL